MIDNLQEVIKNADVNVVIFDIDGTLKDLCKEHSNAVKTVLDRLEKPPKALKKLVLFIDKVALITIKLGILPTNIKFQRMLINIYAILLGQNMKDFGKSYNSCYKREIFMFEGVQQLIRDLSNDHEVYFATTNYQNYNLEAIGIKQKAIFYAPEGTKKISTYNALLTEMDVDISDAIIIGDNIYDDVISGHILGTKTYLVNNYNSKIKSLMAKIINRETRV